MRGRLALLLSSSQILAMLLPTIVALALRIGLFATTWDVPGDGPSRAVEAYQWSRSPWLPTSGVWPPGFLLLHGPSNWLLPRPDVTSRLVNMALGTMTVPAFYVLARRGYGSLAAIVGAWALALWPLHVELSASSLSEAGFLFAMITGLLLVDVGLDRVGRSWFHAVGLACMIWASMTRYEMWWFLPVAPAYVLWRRGRLRPTISTAAAVTAFPIAWLAGNYHASGDPLAGFTAAVRGVSIEGATRVEVWRAATNLGSITNEEIGWPATILLPLLFLLSLRTVGKARSTRRLYVFVTIIFWTASLYFASVRGDSMQSRYLLLGLVLLLPMPALALRGISNRSHPWLGVAAVLGLLISFVSTGRYTTYRWVTSTPPTEMQDVAAWISSSRYRDTFIVLTDMNWTASYLAILWPEVADRRAIISDWIDDDAVIFNVLDRRPALLVTRDGDVDQRSRIEQVLGTRIDAAPLVYESGEAKVFDIALLADAASRR